MVSNRVSLTVAPLAVALMLLVPDIAGQSPVAIHHKHSAHRQSKATSQSQSSADRVEVINGSSRAIQEVDEKKLSRTAAGRAGSPTGADKVDVINGQSWRTQVFNAENAEPCRVAHSQQVGRVVKFLAPQQDKTAPPKYFTVRVFNGARTDERRFEGCGAEEPPLQERLRQRRQKVVVAIESLDSENRRGMTRVVTVVATTESERERGLANPVVVAVASSESERESEGGFPEQFWVTPHPKRPPYHPEAH
jgi:hypothetical protein